MREISEQERTDRNKATLSHVVAAHSAIIFAEPRRLARQLRIQRLEAEIGEERCILAKIEQDAAANMASELMRARFGEGFDVIPALVKPPSKELMILAIDGDRLLVRREEPNVDKPETGRYVTHIFGPAGERDRRECVEHLGGGHCAMSIHWPSVNVAPLAERKEVEAAEAESARLDKEQAERDRIAEELAAMSASQD